MHLTGLYPGWWTGRRFQRPVRMWAAGVTAESTRDNPQRVLIGPPQRKEEWGTGAIPAAALKRFRLGRGVGDCLDSVTVQWHAPDGQPAGDSVLSFKSYEKGREKWQGETLDGVWFDEEPPADIYTEGLTRTNATGGVVMITFTPLKGMSEVVGLFLEDESGLRRHRFMSIDDAAHYTEAEREAIVAAYPPHEREARAKGVPSLGSGRVFPVTDEQVTVEPFPIPDHWPQITGLDFGWDHPFAAAGCAWDREADCFYVVREYREREATPHTHAAAIRPWGDWIPCAWPHDGLQHDKGSGRALKGQYEQHGLNLLAEPATFEGGGNSVEAGLLEMLERMQTGRWKVFSTCGAWLAEFRQYHRKDGRLVKKVDDLISASRYALMARRLAAVRTRGAETLAVPDFGVV
jgi:phage terminase large subunit-like protein